MTHWFHRVAGIAILGAALACWGCGGDQETSGESPPQAEDDSTALPVILDSSTVSDARVLSAEPTTPIVENLEIEATGNESVGYCDVRDSDNLCINFTGSAWTQEGARAECANAPGSSFRTATCPSGHRVGTCVIHPNGDASLEMVHSFYEPMDPILAEGICPGRFEAE